jgi:hypothetical protein
MARTFGTPQYPTALKWAMLDQRLAAAQPAPFGEFGRGALDIASQAMGGGEQGMHERHFRGGATRPFEPRDRLVRARLQEMHMPDPHIEIADAGIERTEPDGLLRERDYFLDRPGQQLAIGQNVQHCCRVRIDRERHLIFGNSLLASVTRSQYHASGQMSGRAAGRGRQGSIDQLFRAREVRRSRVSHSVEHAVCERVCQQALRFGGSRV